MRKLLENENTEMTLFVQLVDRAKVDKVLVNGESYRCGTEISCKAGDKITLIHDSDRGWWYVDKSGKEQELGLGASCSFVVPEVFDKSDCYAELFVYQNTWIEDIIQGGSDYLVLDKSTGWVKNISPRIKRFESRNQNVKIHLNESVQKITLEQFLNVYDCEMNGTVEVHTKSGLLFKLPLEDDDTLNIQEFFRRPIYKIDRFYDSVVVYI